MTDEKVRENKLRRMAARQGLRLKRSRRREPMAYDYGTYMIVDSDRNFIVSGERLSIDDVERWLLSQQPPEEPPSVPQPAFVYEDTPRKRYIDALNRYVRLNDQLGKMLRPLVGDPYPERSMVVGSESFMRTTNLMDEVEEAHQDYLNKQRAYMEFERRRQP